MLNLVTVNTDEISYLLEVAMLEYLREDITLDSAKVEVIVMSIGEYDVRGGIVQIDIRYHNQKVGLVTMSNEFLLQNNSRGLTRFLARFLFEVVSSGVLDELIRVHNEEEK